MFHEPMLPHKKKNNCCDLRQLTCEYCAQDPASFISDPIWNQERILRTHKRMCLHK